MVTGSMVEWRILIEAGSEVHLVSAGPALQLLCVLGAGMTGESASRKILNNTSIYMNHVYIADKDEPAHQIRGLIG